LATTKSCLLLSFAAFLSIVDTIQPAANHFKKYQETYVRVREKQEKSARRYCYALTAFKKLVDL